MSDLQREILSMVIIFNDETLSSIKPLLEKILDSELLKTDANANIKEMDIYDKIDALKAVASLSDLSDNSPTISYEQALKELGLEGDCL